MMKLLIKTMLVLLAAVLLAMTAREDPGYLVINIRHWSIETSVVFAAIVVLVAFALIYLALRFMATTSHAPRNIRRWQQQHRIDRAGEALTHGLIELAKGDWARAERKLTKHIGHSKTPLLNYLAAARAAQKQGHDERRDAYLKQAYQCMPRAGLAIGLTQAELQISHGQIEQALATLTHLKQQTPKHATVLNLLLRLYSEVEDWERLLELLPTLLRRKLLSREQADGLRLTAYRGLLQRAINSDSDVLATWQRIPKTLRHDAAVLVDYVNYLMKHDGGGQAEVLIQQALNRHWHDHLAYLYGCIEGGDVGRQIRQAETWLKSRSQNAMLLLTLGRLCRRQQLWTKAQQYLKASIDSAPHAETYRELAQLLEQRGEQSEALAVYRQGMMTSPELGTRPAAVFAPSPPLPDSGITADDNLLPFGSSVK